MGNQHATTDPKERNWADSADAGAAAHEWAQAEPVILGGDFNLRRPEVEGFAHAAGHHVDHVFLRGLAVRYEAEVLNAGRLSDHRPLRVSVGAARSRAA